ncbi:tetratricopeptide repeat protein [Variovorax sp. EL159]|uniref:tetratricopeptide repeat protein n=1 Tax=Variovorax sp. EL159 TaxID=1566270 RepID=UPI0008900337|nr:tetratricopeptide repeat protein [Variovorax sp. EL159]SCX72965.1 TM2 domain-containing membrane protein YozV [Variovorax sp. EL159]
MSASPRRKPLAYLLLVVGGFLGAHRFYLGRYRSGAAQLLLLLVGTMSSLPGAKLCLGALLLWLLADIYWVHRQSLDVPQDVEEAKDLGHPVPKHVMAIPQSESAQRVASHQPTTPATQLKNQELRYMAAFRQGDLQRAEALCAEAVELARRLGGGPGEAVVSHLVNLAEIRRQMQRHDRAIAALDECMNMIGQLRLPDSWRLRPTNTLALVYAATGRPDEAEALYKKTIALAITEAKGGSTDAVVRALNNLAFLHATTGQPEKAELCYARAMTHLDKLAAASGSGEAGSEGDAELYSNMLNNFADLLAARRDFAKARPLYERSLAIQERSCRGISTVAANAHNDLGLIAQELGDLRLALVHFKRTLLLNQICAPDHFKNIANAQRNVDGVSATLDAMAHAARVERNA